MALGRGESGRRAGDMSVPPRAPGSGRAAEVDSEVRDDAGGS